jgi:hypothetical protein
MQPANSPALSDDGIQRSRFGLFNIFKRDYERYEGVPPINIYLLRLLFTLMFFFLSYTSWTHILHHTGPWDPANSAAWFMWASCALIAGIGILRPLKMLPIVLFEIIYKVACLSAVPAKRIDRNAGRGHGRQFYVGYITYRGHALEVFFQNIYCS